MNATLGDYSTGAGCNSETAPAALFQRPQLLQLAQTNIAHPSTGAQLRNFHIAAGLSKVMDVRHLGFADKCDLLSRPYAAEHIETALIQREKAYTPAKLLLGAIGSTPATVLNHRSGEMTSALAGAMRRCDYDIVQIEGIEMSSYVAQVKGGRPRFIVVDWHNIESDLVSKYAANARTLIHKLYFRRAVSQIRRLEDKLFAAADLNLVTGYRDRDLVLKRNPAARVLVVENGVDVDAFADQRAAAQDPSAWRRRIRMLFVGSMDYRANADAVLNFAFEIWPKIRSSLPQAIFTIVGRNPSAEVRALTGRDGIEVTGTVADVRPYYDEAFAVVAPLRIGGGTRLKILEAMAAGTPVISTTTGAEGLDVVSGTHLYLANSIREFVEASRVLQSKWEAWRHISTEAAQLVTRRYDWGQIVARLANFYVEILCQPRAMRGVR